MKAKENHSGLEEAAAVGIMAFFIGIAAFICGFFVWSVLCMEGAIISLLV